MDFDLTRGLHDLSRTPTVGPEVVPVDRVLTRVHRERALRATAVTTLSAAAVVGIAVAVQAVGPEPQPPTPPAQTTTPPSPAPTTTAGPTPTSTPTAEPTGTPDTPPPPIVAVTPAGELVLLDPGTGERLTTVTDGIESSDPGKVRLTVDDDRTVAYVSQSVRGEYSILRVSLTDGSTEPLATGLLPSLSPDGGTLAFAGPDPAAPQGTESWGLNLLDLTTDEVRHVTAGPYNPARWVGEAEWAPDGTSLYIELGWEGGGDIVHVDVGTTTSLRDVEDAPLVPEDGQAHAHIQLLADGRMVLASVEGGHEPAPESHRVLVLDGTATVVDEVDGLAGMGVLDSAAPVDARTVAVLARDMSLPWEPVYRLYVWDGGDDVTPLGDEPYLAIAW